MMESPEQIVHSYFDGVNGFRDGRNPFSRFAPDFMYTIVGTTPVSGTYRGADELLRGVEPFLTRLESLRVDPRETLVAGDRVVVLADGQGKSRTGESYRIEAKVRAVDIMSEVGRFSKIRLKLPWRPWRCAWVAVESRSERKLKDGHAPAVNVWSDLLETSLSRPSRRLRWRSARSCRV
jgi:ketosteroid isomerase-like protein